MRQVRSVPGDTCSGTTYHLTEGSTFLGNSGHHKILVTLPGELEKKVHLSNIKINGIHHVSPDSSRNRNTDTPTDHDFADVCDKVPVSSDPPPLRHVSGNPNHPQKFKVIKTVAS